MAFISGFLVEQNANLPDMINHARVADVMKQGQIECVGQDQSVYLFHDTVEDM